MAGVQFAQRGMPPQQGGYHDPHQGGGYHQQQPMQQQYAPQHPGMHPGGQQMHPHPGMHPQGNHHDPHMGGGQQNYYHERMDGKQAGAEQLQERKMQEIQALTFEINQLQQASDPNAAAASIAERMGQQNDPFNDDSEWNMKTGGGGGCCIIQ